MSLTLAAPQQENDRYLAPADNHPARCVEVIDLGTQEEEWEGEKSSKHKIRITWELVNEELGADLHPVISHEYTASLHEQATLRAHLEGWRGTAFTPGDLQEFELEKLLGTSCMVQVVHKISKAGNEYAKVSSVGKVPKGLLVTLATRDQVKYSTDDGENVVFQSFPQWLQEQIASSPEFQQAKKNPSGSAEPQGAIPTESEEVPF